MASFNRVILAGNLTRDPELRYLTSGTGVAKIGLALNRSWRSESGEQREEVTFVDVEAFGKQAETISQYLRKGSPILVEGRLRLDQWDDRQSGQKRSRLLVVMERFSFLDSPGTRANPGAPSPAPATQTRPAPPPPSAAAAHAGDDMPPPDDDVPF